MVILIDSKKFYKNYKDFAKASPINDDLPMLIINGTNDHTIKDLATGDTVFDCLRAKDSILEKGYLKENDYKNGVRKFLKNRKMLTVVATAAAEIVRDEENRDKPIFVILNKKTYKAFAKKLRNRFEDLTDTHIWFLYDDEDDMRDELEQSFKKKIKKLEKKIDSIKHDDDVARRDKKDKIDKLESQIEDIEDLIKDSEGKKLLKAFIKYSHIEDSEIKKLRKFMKNVKNKVNDDI